MLLSAVINTYNRPEQLRNCLAHLAAQHNAGSIDWEVIIADDGGTTDLAPVVSEFTTRLNIRLHRIAHGGIAAARNAGAAVARGGRLWFLGDDVFPSAGCLTLHAAEQRSDVALLGPYPMSYLRMTPGLRFWFDNRFDKIIDPENAGYFFFLTGNLSMSRSTFEKIGGFDTQYNPYGWEDIDIGLKFEQAGGRIRFEPGAHATHAHHAATRELLWERELIVGKTGYLFFKKWKHLGPLKLTPVRFWHEPISEMHSGPPWRYSLGKLLLAVSDSLIPRSRITARLYERMVYATRTKGFLAARDADPQNHLLHG